MTHHAYLALAGLIFQAAAFAQTSSSTTLTSSPNPSNYGQPVTLTATVTAGATGKVSFYDGNNILGVATLSNEAGALPRNTWAVRNNGQFLIATHVAELHNREFSTRCA